MENNFQCSVCTLHHVLTYIHSELLEPLVRVCCCDVCVVTAGGRLEEQGQCAAVGERLSRWSSES